MTRARLGGGGEGAWFSFWKGCGQGQYGTRVMSAYRPAFLHYSCFLAAAGCGLSDRGCVAVAGKVEKYGIIILL